MWRLSTATAYGVRWLLTRVVTPLPSRLALVISPSALVQYRRGAGGTPVALSRAVALASGRVPAALSCAWTSPGSVLVNRTVIVQDWRGGSAPRQVVAVMANVVRGVTVRARFPLAEPPELVSLNVVDAVSPTST